MEKTPKLSPIQKRVLELIVIEGLTQEQMALELNRSRDTIKHYCFGIRQSFGVVSMYQAVALAVKYRIVEAPSLSTSPK